MGLAQILLALAVGLVGLAVSVLIALLLRQPLANAKQVRAMRQLESIYGYILETGMAERAPMSVFRQFCPVLVARATHEVLSFAQGEAVEQKIMRAREIGLRQGAFTLGNSRHAADRLLAAQLLGHVRAGGKRLLELASRDPAMAVRSAAITSLAAINYRLKPKTWSQFMRLGNDHPHTSVRKLLENPDICPDCALQAAALSPQAHASIRIWSIAALAARDRDAGDDLIVALVNGFNPAPEVVAGALEQFSDPLRLTVLQSRVSGMADWRIRAAFAGAVQRTYAVTLMPYVAQMATDSDWRVRRVALAAMRRLGGFDSVAVPKPVRDQLADSHKSDFATFNFEALLDEADGTIQDNRKAAVP